MSTTSVAGVTRLRLRAQACPILGSALQPLEPAAEARGYASEAGQREIDAIHRASGVKDGVKVMGGAAGNVCPHAGKAMAAAEMVAVEAKRAKAAAQAMAKRTPVVHSKASKKHGFNYDKFYETELEKKHQDKSYR